MYRLFASLFLVFALFSFLHSGRTDANGGHWDYSSGEYHYHHGYPAHDHYDIDDDGDIDCPYDFDDKTNTGKTYGGKIEKEKTTTTTTTQGKIDNGIVNTPTISQIKIDNAIKHNKTIEQEKISTNAILGIAALSLAVGYVLLLATTHFGMSLKKSIIIALAAAVLIFIIVLHIKGVF